MQPITIAALCIAAIAMCVAVIILRSRQFQRRRANSYQAAFIAVSQAEQQTNDSLENLKRTHLKLGSSYAEAEQFLAAERADHATTRAKLARMDASQRPRATGGRFGAKVVV